MKLESLSLLFIICPWNIFRCCVDADTVRVYDYVTKTSLCLSRFNAPGCSMLWAPKIVSMLYIDMFVV